MIETAKQALEVLMEIKGYVEPRFVSRAQVEIDNLHQYLTSLQQPVTDNQQVRNELDGFIRTMDKHQQAIEQLQQAIDVNAKQLGKHIHMSVPIHNWITLDD